MYNLIVEQTSNIPFSSLQILQEEKTASGEPKVIFTCRLQTQNEHNQNKRYYSSRICKKIVEQLKPKAKDRALLMEVDHPTLTSSDQAVIKKRAATTEIKNCGALLRDIRIEGNDIIGEVETLSGFKGPDLAKTLLYDQLNIGFSLRAFGALEAEPNGSFRVKEPIKALT